MKAKVKKLWIAALRSGEFKQAEGALREDSNRCCLGVLCDVFRRETGCGRWKRTADNESVWAFIVDDDSSDAVLPKSVYQWAGLSTSNPNLNGKTAVYLNDSGHDFNQIADRIEKYL